MINNINNRILLPYVKKSKDTDCFIHKIRFSSRHTLNNESWVHYDVSITPWVKKRFVIFWNYYSIRIQVIVQNIRNVCSRIEKPSQVTRYRTEIGFVSLRYVNSEILCLIINISSKSIFDRSISCAAPLYERSVFMQSDGVCIFHIITRHLVKVRRQPLRFPRALLESLDYYRHTHRLA